MAKTYFQRDRRTKKFAKLSIVLSCSRLQKKMHGYSKCFLIDHHICFLLPPKKSFPHQSHVILCLVLTHYYSVNKVVIGSAGYHYKSYTFSEDNS